jgi:SAM-dependent methyltransferase
VDFNKSCEEGNGKFLPLAGVPVYYALCSKCGFCFAPEISKWSLDEFAEKIYNNQYALVDPDYLEARPRANATNLLSNFGNSLRSVRHLDYGGGDGALAKILRKSGWDSTSYDPFVNRDTRPDQLGQFELITAFEVFEHVPDVQGLMSQLRMLLAPNGVVMFSTLLSDGNIHSNQRIGWWYASPRNGHISLFSKNSLAILAQGSKFNFGSFSSGFHTFFTNVPPWASDVIRSG